MTNANPNWTLKNWIEEGTVVGKNVVDYDAFVDRAFPWLVEIGNDVVLTGCTILAHDGSIHPRLGYSKVGVTRIGNGCFVGYGAIVLAGVTVGDGCMIGAGSVVTKDVPAGSVYVGNGLGRVVCSTKELVEKHRSAILSGKFPVFDDVENLSDEEKAEMRRLLKEAKGGYAK